MTHRETNDEEIGKNGPERTNYEGRIKQRTKRQEELRVIQDHKEAVDFIRSLDGKFSVTLKDGINLDVDIITRDRVEQIFTLIKNPALESEKEREEGLVNKLAEAANDNEIKEASEETKELVKETAQRIKGYYELLRLFMEMCDGFDTIGSDNVTRMLVLKPGAENYLQDWHTTEFNRNDLNYHNNRPDRGLENCFVVSPYNLGRFYDTFKRCRGEQSIVKTGWGFRAEINGIQMAFMAAPFKKPNLEAANDNQQESEERFAA